MTDDASELIGIGEFAQRTQLSHKALRIYAETGLLAPAAIDDASGYRRYGAAQVHTGRLIALLRAADLSLTMIRSVLDTAGRDRDAAALGLDEIMLASARDHHARTLVIRHVQAILREEQDRMFEIKIRRVGPQRLMSIQRRQTAERTDAFAAEAKATFARHLDGRRPTGPFMLIFHGQVSEQADGPIEAALPVSDDIEPSDLVGIRSEPAHEQAYTTITKAQWAYPAILAAYDAVASSAAVRDQSASPLSCREVYLAEPEAIGEGDLICDIAFPLAEAQL